MAKRSAAMSLRKHALARLQRAVASYPNAAVRDPSRDREEAEKHTASFRVPETVDTLNTYGISIQLPLAAHTNRLRSGEGRCEEGQVDKVDVVVGVEVEAAAAGVAGCGGLVGETGLKGGEVEEVRVAVAVKVG